MRKIKLLNKEVISLLNEFKDYIFGLDLTSLDDTNNMLGLKEPFEYGITDDYLSEMIKLDKDHSGFPEAIHGQLLEEWFGNSSFFDKEIKQEVDKITLKLTQYLTAHRNALCAYYPPGGYITWHTNWNASGYNLIMSYSEDGSGSFSYIDPETRDFHKVQDEPGVWTAKVGYFGTYEEGPHF